MAKDRRISNIVCRLDPVSIASDRAVSIGMIVTELLTNAIKYAYPGESQGEIRVELKRTSNDGAILVVEDDGEGFDPEGPIQGTGLGSRIIASMAKTIGSGIQYIPRDRGTRAEVPLDIR
jgi:two-component sensor histidine kinase